SSQAVGGRDQQDRTLSRSCHRDRRPEGRILDSEWAASARGHAPTGCKVNFGVGSSGSRGCLADPCAQHGESAQPERTLVGSYKDLSRTGGGGRLASGVEVCVLP